MQVSIHGLNKALVLTYLYNYAFYCGPQGINLHFLRYLAWTTPPLLLDEVQEWMSQKLASSKKLLIENLSLGKGFKALNIDLSESQFDSTSYDLYHGLGMAQWVVNLIQYTFWANLKLMNFEANRLEHRILNLLAQAKEQDKKTTQIEQQIKTLRFDLPATVSQSEPTVQSSSYKTQP